MRPHPCQAPPRGGAGWRRGIPGRAALHAPWREADRDRVTLNGSVLVTCAHAPLAR